MERKKELRKWIRQEKAKHSTSTLAQLSVEILTILEQLPAFREAQTVLLYHSLKDEVCTHRFIEKWAGTKNIILPVVVGDELELRLYTGSEDLDVNHYGIAEPTGSTFTEYNSIDIAIIPGVAFDISGNRLGRGKGYYDKLLLHIPAFKVGICFPFQLIKDVPADVLDVKMDVILTTRTGQ